MTHVDACDILCPLHNGFVNRDHVLEYLNWLSLEDSSKYAGFVMMFKIANEKVAITKEDRL